MITKDELKSIGFAPLDKFGLRWSLDGNRILYNVKTQILYDADEVGGDDEELCVVKEIDELKDLIYSYFNVDVE
jgi:hypothetical protein